MSGFNTYDVMVVAIFFMLVGIALLLINANQVSLTMAKRLENFPLNYADISPHADNLTVYSKKGKLLYSKGTVLPLPTHEGVKIENNDMIVRGDFPIIIPSVLLPRQPVPIDRAHQYPTNIFVSFYSSLVSPSLWDSYSNIADKHPYFTVYFYDDISCRQMLIENFEPEVAEAYDDLIPGAFKCDLWRLCVLYLYGGIYYDIRYCPLLNFDEIISPEVDYFCVNDVPLRAIHTAVIACRPRYPLMKMYIDKIVDNVKNRRYGSSSLDITGPLTLGRVLFGKLQEEGFLQSRLPEFLDCSLGKIQSINFNVTSFYHETQQGKQVAITKMPGCRDNGSFYRITKKEPYGKLWNARKVFREKDRNPK